MKLLKLFLLISSTLLIIFLLLKIYTTSEHNVETHFKKINQDKIFSIKGFSATNSSGGQLVYQISADELTIAPKKLGIFKIKIYNEFSMKNAHIEISLFDSKDRAEFFQLGQVGPVTQGISDGFELSINRNSKPLFLLTAEQAKLDTTRKKTTLLKAVLTHVPSGEKVASRSLVWEEAQQRFLIPGSFLRETPNGRRLDKSVAIDLDFHFSPLH